MTQQGFEDYTYFIYGRKTGAANSYIQAIHILDRIFELKDIFGLKGKSLTKIDDAYLLQRIAEFVSAEEKKFESGQDSIFIYGLSNQTSYPKGGFCSAAVRHLQRYQTYDSQISDADAIVSRLKDGKEISKELIKKFDITKEGRDEESMNKVRIGQAYFRKMILSIYSNKCCVTKINVPELLRASHISEWSKDKNNRMNPENGLCLCGTYDLAFDQHLISFDEKYRMIIGREIREHFTNTSTRDHFEKYVGKKIDLPSMYLPSQALLEKHREQLH